MRVLRPLTLRDKEEYSNCIIPGRMTSTREPLNTASVAEILAMNMNQGHERSGRTFILVVDGHFEQTTRETSGKQKENRRYYCKTYHPESKMSSRISWRIGPKYSQTSISSRFSLIIL